MLPISEPPHGHKRAAALPPPPCHPLARQEREAWPRETESGVGEVLATSCIGWDTGLGGAPGGEQVLWSITVLPVGAVEQGTVMAPQSLFLWNV